jgi:ATP-dependent DNA helicase RecG
LNAVNPIEKTGETDTLNTLAVSNLKGVGPKLAEKLQGLAIHKVQDLLFHLPLRYQDRTRITSIASLRAGRDVVIEGEVTTADIVYGRRRSLVCRLQDGSGAITLRFFHFNARQKSQLSSGTRLRCYGESRHGSSGVELIHPEYQCINDHAPDLPTTLTPVYPTTEGLHQASWRKLIQQALAMMQTRPPLELLPPVNQAGGASLGQALGYLHNPPGDADQALLIEGRHPAQQRLALEELIAHHLGLLKLRQQSRRQHAPGMAPQAGRADSFLATLPFSLTAAQQRVFGEISADLASHTPMLRLVQGDVGSGKTVVAALVALQAVAAGFQVALMAPTEILAEQHLANFQHWFEPQGIVLARLLGRLKGKVRQAQLDAIASGEAGIVIGTHALFQNQVNFARLGLIIVDEQHRFGVHQRLELRQKGSDGMVPHQLVMTATPIPRTLAMTAYADLDCSVIDELPPGRTPVKTVAVDNSRRDEVLQRVRVACEAGSQAYWVCTTIDESEALQAQAAELTAEALKAALPELSVALVHGRLKPQDKAAVMDAFKRGQVDLLVATTVIEVGVDVPRASLMIIENPERLGLAQLHQLRGRVGRGHQHSHCVLLYQAPLSASGKSRLEAMRQSNDGFTIAERDLELRGPGELLGTRQTGMMEFRIADLLRDKHLIDEVRQQAQLLVDHYPQRVEPLIKRWIPQGDIYVGI